MLEFVGKVFRTWFEAILWVCLLGFVIAGGVIGSLFARYSYNAGGYVFIGILLGGIVGFMFIILGGGLVSNFLGMVDNIEKIAKQGNSEIPIEVPDERIGGKYKVRLLTNAEGLGMRQRPEGSQEPFRRLPNGTEVELLEIGDEVALNGRKGSWYKIKTDDGIKGWCFSGSLELMEDKRQGL
jgi:hypothetical protein